MQQSRISIIGGGKVGTALVRFFDSRGLVVNRIISRNQDRFNLLREEFGMLVSASVMDIPASPIGIFICTQDGAIAAAAKSLYETENSFEDVLIAHTSGLRTSDELQLLRERGAVVGSFHPIQSFPSPDMEPEWLEGIGCGLEGDETFIARATVLATALGWKPLIIRKEDKPIYHAACVFAGNFLAAFAEQARRLMGESTDYNVSISHILPMMQAVLQRLQRTPFEEAVTGPAARGDAASIETHMDALRIIDPSLAKSYSEWTTHIMDMLNIDNETRSRIADILDRRRSG